MRRLVWAMLPLALSGCGGGGIVTSPTAGSESPASPQPLPAWRQDRGDAVNWIAGHMAEGQAMDWGGHIMKPLLDGNAHAGRIVMKTTQDGTHFEVLEYDDVWVYHVEDHAGVAVGATWGVGGGPYAAYHWLNRDGTRTRWMPRRVTPGFYYANEADRHFYAMGSCGPDEKVFHENLYAHVAGLETIVSSGVVVDALHSYFEHPGNGDPRNDTSEHYYYAWDQGWVRWHDARNASGWTGKYVLTSDLTESACGA
jgi:hypothetical protein